MKIRKCIADSLMWLFRLHVFSKNRNFFKTVPHRQRAVLASHLRDKWWLYWLEQLSTGPTSPEFRGSNPGRGLPQLGLWLAADDLTMYIYAKYTNNRYGPAAIPNCCWYEFHFRLNYPSWRQVQNTQPSADPQHYTVKKSMKIPLYVSDSRICNRI